MVRGSQWQDAYVIRRTVQGMAAAGLAALGCATISFGVWRLSQPPLPVPNVYTSAPVSTHYGLPASLPINISIPVIGVHSALASTGLNADGTPAVPVGNFVDEPSWLTTSATPGSAGTAVIVGHVDTARSGPSVFYNLAKIPLGSPIYIQRQDKRTAVFAVYASRVFDKNALPAALVYGSSASPTLRLITCAGSWDNATHQYTQNLVIFASLARAG